jgi:hypothetical protein
MVMGDLLVQTSEDLRGQAETDDKGNALLHARDKRTGRILKSVALPMPGQYGMMTFMHGGKQYTRRASGQRASKSARLARRSGAAVGSRRCGSQMR